MKVRRVIYAEQAEEDLRAIYRWVRDRAGITTATNYGNRLQDFCEMLDIGSERGTSRTDLMPGLRTIGFERKITIAFVVDTEVVRIVRVFGAGKDWESEFS